MGENFITDRQFLNAKIQYSLTHNKRRTFVNILGYIKLPNALAIYSGEGQFRVCPFVISVSTKVVIS